MNVFPAKRCKKATELMRQRRLEYQRNNPVGSRHILLIAASESLQHHAFSSAIRPKTESEPTKSAKPDTQFGSNSAWAAAQSQKAEYIGCRIFR